MVITDRGMQALATATDQWLIEAGPRGAGQFIGRITPSGKRLFYFRYTDPAGKRVRLPIGSYEPKGRGGLKLAEARAVASDWSRLYQSGERDIRGHLADLQAAEIAAKHTAVTQAEATKREADESARLAALEQQRRLTVRQVFDRWAETELTPHIRADGKRTGRKDSGQYTREQFERRVFPDFGDVAMADVRKADVLSILDGVKAEGKLRTTNVLLADLKQMFRFAAEREIIPHSPIETIKKRQAGGADTERDRVLSVAELTTLSKNLPSAHLNQRSERALWIVLSSGCRERQVMRADVFVLALLANLGVGADSEALHTHFGFRRPLTKSLGQQRDGRHQEQSRATVWHELFSDLEGSEGLPRATSHDELAAVTFRKTFFGLLECLLLMITKLLFCLQLDSCRLLHRELGPINRAVSQVLNSQPRDRNMLIF